MLSMINTLVGFAALFTLLSLIVTTAVQLLRTSLGFGSRRVAETLLRLFGEIDDPRRFVAAILSHPTLTGPRGYPRYKTLVDPESRAEKVRRAVDQVLAAHRRLRSRVAYKVALGTWPAADLDKQTVKDLASTVYARIGPIVDPFPDASDAVDGAVLARWGASLRQAVSARPPASPAAPGKDVGTATAEPHRGRLWLLATAAFPEGEGKANPIKTYIAAFHDESAASASDVLTLRIRRYTAIAALVLALILQLDAVTIWDRFSGIDAKATDRFAREVESLGAAETSSGAGRNEAAPGLAPNNPQIQRLQQEVQQIRSLPLDLAPRNPFDPAYLTWAHAFGLLLAWVALSLGAPFWFQILKSAINMKSAFTEEKKTG